MGHRPHLLIEGPWGEADLALSDSQTHHLMTVLRKRPGDRVSYTDGQGAFGTGVITGTGSVNRGDERVISRPTPVDVAVAPPSNKDRARFLVEKLGELGVARLLWLRTSHGPGHVVKPARARTWAQAALEQSRGAWLLDIGDGLVGWEDLVGPIAVCKQGGGSPRGRPRTVVIGPEGGWSAGEIPDDVETWGLTENVLRVETAAVVAAALILGQIPE